jgi:hypothetical protein
MRSASDATVEYLPILTGFEKQYRIYRSGYLFMNFLTNREAGGVILSKQLLPAESRIDFMLPRRICYLVQGS